MLRPTRSLLRRIAPAAFAAAFLLAILPGVASGAEAVFQFTGRGFGHGIGMSQYGARGYAERGWTYDAILSHYYTHTKLVTVPPKSVIVYLQEKNVPQALWQARTVEGTMSLTGVPAASPLTAKVTTQVAGSAGQVYTFTATSDGRVQVWFKAREVAAFKGDVTMAEVAPAGHAAMLIVASESGPWGWHNVAYRGSLRFSPKAGVASLRLYNVVGLEDYVRGVVPRESPASWPAEALKAQAVAARSYVMAGGPEVFCTTRSQVYNGWGVWNGVEVVRHDARATTPGTDAKVDAPCAATAGQVLVDADATTAGPIVKAYFFSTSGGWTEDKQNVWGGSADVHFSAVSDPYERSSRHIWFEQRTSAGVLTYNGQPCYSASVVRAKLAAKQLPVPGTLTDIQVTQRGHSGRVMAILLKGAAGDDKLLSGADAIAKFKNAFGWGDTWFYVSRFSFDATSAVLEPGGSVTVGFHVSGAPSYLMNGTITGLLKDGVYTSRALTVKNGYGTVTFTAPGVYLVDSSASNHTDANGWPDPSGGDRRGTQWYVRNPLAGFRVTAAPAFTKTTRIEGPDRYAVSVNASKASFPATSGAVIVVNGAAYADALTASALAGSVPGGAPVLFTTRDVLPATVKAEIARLKPARAYIVGGPGSVGEPVLAAVRSVPGLAGAATARITGRDRYDVARNVALEVRSLGGAVGRVIVVNGYNYADAVAAAGFAYRAKLPILLVTASAVPTPTASAIATLAPTASLVVGGTGSVTPAVRAALPGARGIADGVDRYDMAARLATYLTTREGFLWTRPYLASGTAFSDALVGGPVAGRSNGPLLFVRSGAVPPQTAAALSTYKPLVSVATILGGPGTVSVAVQRAVETLLR